MKTSKIKQKYIDAIKKRGFETSFATGFKNEPWSKAKEIKMNLIDTRKGYRSYHIEGWKKYSRNTVYHCAKTYIAGVDNGQYWANQIPGTILTIDVALDWLKPAEVKRAKKVLRQGDVFIIEKKKDCLGALPSSHAWNPETRTLTHKEHKHIHVPFPCKFISCRQLSNGKGRD